jgi:hypothetical protein
MSVTIITRYAASRPRIFRRNGRDELSLDEPDCNPKAAIARLKYSECERFSARFQAEAKSCENRN